MGKTLGKIALGAALIGTAFVTGGASIGLTAGFAGSVGVGLSTTALGSSLLLAGASQIAMGAATAAGLGPKAPKPSSADTGFRSRVTIDPQRDQWIVVGQTAAPSVMILADTQGTNNDTLSMIFVHACHAVSGFVGLSINNVATTYSPSVTGDYAGVLTVQTADGTQTANPFTSVAGGRWGSAHKGQGLAMSHLRWTYDREKLAAGLPQNVQFVVKGIKVYDPRRDSTRGGSGSMRANDESTWAYTAGGSDIGRNPVLVELTYRLGWKKNGRLWAGMGEDPANIDFASYIAAANICDETVNGKPRYRIDGVLSLAVSHNENLARIHATCAGRSIDQGGLIAFWVAHDDTASPVMTLTDDDYKSSIAFDPLPPGARRNTGRGTFIDPANFYQAQPYPEVQPAAAYAADNSVELADTLSYDMVQDIDQARRLTAIRINESRQGDIKLVTSLRALKLRPLDIVALDHPRWGWSGRKARVETWSLTPDFRIALALSAVSAADYADLTNVSTSSPASLVPDGYMPILGDLAGLDAVDLADGSQVLNRTAANIQYSGGVAVESLKPAEAGATDGGQLGDNITTSGGVLLDDATVINLYGPDANLFSDPFFGRFVSPFWATTVGITVSNAGTAGSFILFASGGDYYCHQVVKPAKAGDRVDCEIELLRGAGVNGHAGLYVWFFNDAGTIVDQDWALQITPGQLSTAVWTRFVGSRTAPAGTASVLIGIRSSQTGSDNWYARYPRGYVVPAAALNVDVNSRIIRSVFLSTGLLLGPNSTVSAVATAADQGGGTGVTITIPSHTRKVSNVSGADSISYNSGTLTNRSYSTTYHIYADDPTLAGGAVTYQSTTNADDLMRSGRYHVTTIPTPASGAGSTGGSGGGGGVRPLNPGEQIP